MSHPLDPGYVFDRFVVGPANRVATGAALRAAESPGRSYNPLVISGPRGVGKTHLLMAIGQRARLLDPELLVHYETGDSFVDRLTRSLASGSVDALREAAGGIDVLLLDGLQQVAGAGRTQLELLRVIDELVARGAQLVIASTAQPADVAGLDPGLVARLAGGLNVELAPPEEATRRAILARLVGDGGHRIDDDVLSALARLPVQGVPELQSAFSRVVAAADLAGRGATVDDVDALRSAALADVPLPPDEFDTFLTDISTAVAAVVETAPWRRRLAEAILRWEGEGIRTRRLEAALDADSAPDVEALLTSFGRDVGRLRHIARELPPGAAADPQLLRDPDRLSEAERLLAEAKAARRDGAAAASPAGEAAGPGGTPPLPLAAATVDRWFLDPEKMAWDWLALDDRMVEEQR